MTKVQDKIPLRPSLALRIGVTGSRRLCADQLYRINSQVTFVLNLAKQEMARLSQEASVRDYYAHVADEATPVTLRMISPLARGADRLVARVALDKGYQLYVPMPFAQSEYEKDFLGSDSKHPEEAGLTAEGDLAEFRGLLAKASAQFCLDGDRHANPVRADDSLAAYAYEAVGRFVVRNCDLLIAIWDGKSSNGRGGTAEIVYHAATNGIPVWWINAREDSDPVWLSDVQDLRDPAPSKIHPEARLQAHLNRLIPAPPQVHRQGHGWIGYLGAKFQANNLSRAAIYFDEQPHSKTFLWKLFSKTYARVMVWASHVSVPWTPPRRPEDAVSRYWFDLYEPADVRAGEFASRYRSGYLLVIMLTTSALVMGAFALGFALLAHGENHGFALAGLVAAVLELLTLTIIVVLVAASLGAEWHERSIEYRLLAELFRKQQTLAPLGWALSIGNVQQLDDSKLADEAQLSWVVWLFAAAQRSAPLPHGALARAEHGDFCRLVLEDLIDEQLAYHRGREQMSLNASATFEKWGSRMFVLVLFFVALKVLIELQEPIESLLGDHAFLKTSIEMAGKLSGDHLWIVVALGLLATVLPGISAAFVAIRSYAELEMLAEQSSHMIAELERAKARVQRLNLQRPLVLQDLGAEASAVATIMLQDLEGWGRLFRGKMMEAS